MAIIRNYYVDQSTVYIFQVLTSERIELGTRAACACKATLWLTVMHPEQIDMLKLYYCQNSEISFQRSNAIEVTAQNTLINTHMHLKWLVSIL